MENTYSSHLPPLSINTEIVKDHKTDLDEETPLLLIQKTPSSPSTSQYQLLRSYSGFFTSPFHSPKAPLSPSALVRRKLKFLRKKNKASEFSIIMNLVCLQLGAGTLSLPWAAAGSSLIGCILITIFAFVIIFITSSMTVAAAEQVHVYDLCKLLGTCYVQQKFLIGVLMYIVLLLSNGACLIGYMVILLDLIDPTLSLFSGSHHTDTERRVVLLLCVCILLYLCYLENLSKLKYTSIFSVGATMFIMFLLFVDAADEPPRDSWCMFGIGLGYVTAFNIVITASCGVQMCALGIYEGMENRSLEAFQRCLVWSFIVTALIFSGFFIPGYTEYGASVTSNIFTDMPVTSLHNAGRVLMFVVIIGVYPLIFQPLVSPFRNGVFCKGNRYVKYVIPPATILLTGFIACLGFDLGPISSLNGAFSFLIFIAVIPVVLGMNFLGLHRKHGFSILVVSFIVCFLGFIWGSENFSADLLCL